MSISMNPETFEEGGLISDVDARIKEAAWTRFEYPNLNLPPQLSLRVTFEPYGNDDFEEFEQQYSAGDLKRLVPSEDGESEADEGPYIAQAEGSSAESLTKTCNAALFLTALVNAGFPAAKLNEGSANDLVGVAGHINREPAPERPGLKKKEDERPKTVLVFTSIEKLPGEKGKKGGKKGPGPKKKAPAKVSSDVSDEICVELVTEVLSDVDGPIPRSKFKAQILKAALARKDDIPVKARKDYVARCDDPEFLEESGFEVDEENQTVSLGE